MSLVSFYCEFQAEELAALQFPVEIRRLNLALVARALTGDSIELGPGAYHATVRLPAGQQVWDTFEIGDPGQFVLRPERPAPFAWIEHRHFLYHDVAGAGDLSAAGPDDTVTLRWFRNWPPAAKWTVTVDAPFVPHAFTQVAVPPNGNSRCLLRVEQRGARPFCLTLPVGPASGCTITFPRTAEGRWRADVTLDHAMGDLLLRYLARDMRDEVFTILQSPRLRFEELLGPNPQPMAALVGAYARLQTATASDIQSWIDWTAKLMGITPWMSDSAIVHAESLARLGKHAESYSALIEAARRGPPLFRKGLAYAVARLGLYTVRSPDRPADRHLSEAQRFLATLKTLAASASYFHSELVTVEAGMEDDLLVREYPQASADGERSVGIHLGRRLATLAEMDGVMPVLLPTAEGDFATPAVVAPSEDGGWLVGRAAQGRPHPIPAGNSLFGEELDHRGKLAAHEGRLSQSEAWAILLRFLKELAQTHLKESTLRAAIAVPTASSDAERELMRQACEQAGFQAPVMVSEAVAAALAYSFDRHERLTLVYELRRRAFSVSLIVVRPGAIDIKSVISEPTLGGDAIDQLMINHFQAVLGPRVEFQAEAATRGIFREAVERVKIQLSTAFEAELDLSGLRQDFGAAAPSLKMNRETLERISKPLINRTLSLCEAALTEAGVKAQQVDDVLLMGRMTRMPLVLKTVESRFARNALAILGSYHLAIGAAVDAANEQRSPIDVLPLSIGIETLGGLFTVMIERNTKLPTRKTEVFSTAEDNQSSVEVKVFQGQRAMASDNVLLGVFQLSGIPPAPRGVPQVEVTFEIDESGRLNVTARDKSRNQEQQLTVTATSGLRRVDVETAMKSAALHAEEDRRAREMAAALNRADAQAYNSEKMLKELGGKMDGQQAKTIRNQIEALRGAMRQGDLEALNSANEQLAVVTQRAISAAYEGGAEAASQISAEKKDAVESEYLDFEEEK